MIAVADTSPICYLVAIREVGVLPRIFSQVLLPRAVLNELLHHGAPVIVQEWASALPPWIHAMEAPVSATSGLDKLQAGEREAILSAESITSATVLLDEKAARRIASARDLRITGTLGILAEAAARGLIELAPAIDRLRSTNFRASPALLKATLDRFRTPT